MKAKSKTANPTAQIKQRFGLRKLSVGLTAVALGAVMMTANNQNAQAASDTNADQSETVQVEKTETAKTAIENSHQSPAATNADTASQNKASSTQTVTPPIC